MKKIYKRMTAVLIACSVFAICVYGACHWHSLTSELAVGEFEKDTYMRFLPEREYVRPIGRTYYDDGVLWFSMSGSGAEFKAKGEYLTLEFHADNPSVTAKHHLSRAAVYKNGSLVLDEIIDSETKTYSIELGGEAVIRIVKENEAKTSAFGLGEIGLYGKRKISPTDESDLKIEFIGDSITCGYGIDEERMNASFSSQTESFTKTYAYLTAENLGADYSAVAFSGYGVLSGFTSNGMINSNSVLGKYYDKSCLLIGRQTLWDFSAFSPDIVVINLGTNDASYCAGSPRRREMFRDEYMKFLSYVRTCNPGAYILCVLGDMNNSLFSCIEEAVAMYTASTGDSRVEAFTVEYRMGENDIVIDGHPGALSQACAARALTEKINSLIFSRTVLRSDDR